MKKGIKKIASGALMPHEIIRQLNLQRIAEFELVAELQWNSYVDRLRQSGLFASALAVCDVSGSMTGVPMEAAIALSLLTAELSQPPFKNYICTFSSSPQLHVIDQPTLKEKAAFVRQMDWGVSTNLRVSVIFLSFNNGLFWISNDSRGFFLRFIKVFKDPCVLESYFW